MLELGLSVAGAVDAGEAVRGEALRFGYTAEAEVLRGLDFVAARGTLTCVTGPSGVGKSTLLYVLAGVLRARGTVRLLGRELPSRASTRARLRLEHCGFVFQRGELLAELSVVDNVALPLRLLGHVASEARARAEGLLEHLGIGDIGDREPTEISGGQTQRASVARALINAPEIVFADEPTGSLDARTRDVVIDALTEAASAGACVVVASHDPAIQAAANAVVDLGAAVSEQPRG